MSVYTERLILRQWKERDILPFFKLNSDPEVMKFFPSLLSQKESNEMATEIQRRINKNGWGFWAVEEKKSKAFIGFVGLNKPKTELPCSPCIEIGWRLTKKFWGNGYATEAGNASLKYAFSELSLKEVVSFTTVSNKRSQVHIVLRVFKRNQFTTVCLASKPVEMEH